MKTTFPTGLGLTPMVTLPLLAGAGEATGDRQIQEELKRDSRLPSEAFNQALQQRYVPEGVPRMGLPPVRMVVDPVEAPQVVEVPEPVSPVNNERDPLLGENAVQRIIDAQPEAGRTVLERNRAQISTLIGGAFQDNEQVITQTGKWLWEYFASKPIQKKTEENVDMNTSTINEQEIPPHCRVQYFWNEQKGRLERIMICTDEDVNQKKRVYRY